MTNVLPPHAKKQIVIEYWTRMVSAWVVVWSLCLLLGAALLWPTYVLLNGKTAAYQNAADQATERTDEFATLGRELVASTQQAEYLVRLKDRQTLSSVMSDVWQVANQKPVSITSLSLAKADGTLVTFRIEGVADDRLALADFRTSLLELPYVADVELPLSDLAENRDIEFGLQITLTSPTP